MITTEYIVGFDKVSKLKGYARTKEQIVAKAKPIAHEMGIYFLIKAGEVVYVGQGLNIMARVGLHTAEKDFDSVSTLPCPKEYLNLLETIFIQSFRPRLNYKYSRGMMAVPLRNVDITAIEEGHYEHTN
tara:strand:- start:1443 stop:1829 length:387 start_codon:yes stop_codon:yes gene_type:complete